MKHKLSNWEIWSHFISKGSFDGKRGAYIDWCMAFIDGTTFSEPSGMDARDAMVKSMDEIERKPCEFYIKVKIYCWHTLKLKIFITKYKI